MSLLCVWTISALTSGWDGEAISSFSTISSSFITCFFFLIFSSKKKNYKNKVDDSFSWLFFQLCRNVAPAYRLFRFERKYLSKGNKNVKFPTTKLSSKKIFNRPNSHTEAWIWAHRRNSQREETHVSIAFFLVCFVVWFFDLSISNYILIVRAIFLFCFCSCVSFCRYEACQQKQQ